MRVTSSRDWIVTLVGLTVLVLLTVLFAQRNEGSQTGPVVTARSQEAEAGEVRVYFSPLGSDAETLRGGLDEELIAALARAETTIDFALYDLNLFTVRDALLAAHGRGVRIRGVIEGDNRAQSVLVDLEEAGIEVVFEDRPPLMHHKFFVLDGQQVWTGSLNWTVNGVYRNNNNLVVLDSSDVAADFTREFEEMFEARRFGELSLNDTPYPFLTVGETAVEVAFSPEDGAQARILRWLDGAESRVDLMAFTLTADPIAEALVDAADRGVVVRGVVEAARTGDLGSDVRSLRRGGLDVRLDTNPATMHHKVILIDGETVITGSYNFTRSAEERNDENLLILLDERVADRYAQEFERLYAVALP